MKSSDGNNAISSPVILDACTIINLLRIDDEDDEFLYKHIIALNLYYAEKVDSEVRANFSKNTLSDHQVKYVDSCLGSLHRDAKYYFNNDIINDVSNVVFDKIKTFGDNHYHKLNGELFSTALSLIVSRIEGKQVIFYTDDKPATYYFTPYFSYQQIGTIMDTVDLLIYLYWSNSDFDKQRLIKYLKDLYSDLNQPLKDIINRVQKIRDTFSGQDLKNTKYIGSIDALIRSYYDLDFVQMKASISEITNGYKTTKIAKILGDYADNFVSCPLISKILKTKKNLDNFDIYKLQ